VRFLNFKNTWEIHPFPTREIHPFTCLEIHPSRPPPRVRAPFSDRVFRSNGSNVIPRRALPTLGPHTLHGQAILHGTGIQGKVLAAMASSAACTPRNASCAFAAGAAGLTYGLRFRSEFRL